MLSKDEIYKIWAPSGGLWSPWVKPVLFSFTDAAFNVPQPVLSFFEKNGYKSLAQLGLLLIFQKRPAFFGACDWLEWAIAPCLYTTRYHFRPAIGWEIRL